MSNKKLQDRIIKNINTIQKSQERGNDSIKAISQDTGISLNMLYSYHRKGHISINPKQTRQDILSKVEDYERKTTEEIRTIKEMKEVTGRSSRILKKEIPEIYNKLEDGRTYFSGGRVSDNRDELIDEARLSPTEMAEILGVTRQAISDYMTRKNKHKSYQEKREEIKFVKPNLLSLLNRLMSEKAQEEGLEKEVGYYLAHPSKKLHDRTEFLQELIQLVENHRTAAKNQESTSYEKLSENLKHIDAQSANKALVEMGYTSLNWTRNPASENLKSSMEDTCKLGFFSNIDLSHFTGIKDFTITYNLRNIKRRKRKLPLRDLRPRDASILYEYKDEINSTNEELAILLNKDIKIIEEGLSKRNLYEPRIIKSLQKLFPDENINKPYL